MIKAGILNTESSTDHFDAIIIGGGAGGLAAAALLAQAGKKALLLEKEPRLGGLVAPVVHGPYAFDVGARLLMGCNADGPFGPGVIHSFLERIGVRQQVEFIPLQPFMHAHFPDVRFSIYSGREQFLAGLRQVAPQGLEELPALLDLCCRIFRTSKAFSTSGKPWTPWRGLVEMPDFVRYAATTAGTMLARYIPDRRARTVAGSLWPYAGIPPSQASFLLWANLMATYIEEGAWYCRGGLYQLAEAIGRAFTRDGGEIRLGCAVRQVLVHGRRVTGVELADGQRCFAPAVIANIDPRQVFGPMMDPAQAPSGYRRGLARLAPADTGISLSFVTDLDLPALGFGFENLIYDAWDERQVERHPLNGQVGFLSLNVTTAADPGLAPPGQHLASAFAGLPLDAPMEPDDVQRYADVLMGVIQQRLPELPGHLLLSSQDGLSAGYLPRAFGPIYGWKATPWQSNLGRPDFHTPVKGLLLAGQWTRPSQGVMSAILSGSEAAKIILRK